MKQLYDRVSEEVSKYTTHTYSTSFSLGIYFLHSRLRRSIYAIYGFVRIADEIVDSFSDYDRCTLILKYRTDTFDAIENKISSNPILNSFQKAVHDYNIDHELIDTFLKSMEMDLDNRQHTADSYNQYILGSAEVVGLMCLHVFTEGNRDLFESLKPYAMKLGSAFQKVNFLRDIKDDYCVLGRMYFPGVDFNNFSLNVKRQIEAEIEEEFRIALQGIRKLPVSSRGGVYLAYVYYQSLFRDIKKLSAGTILKERVRINNRRKFGLMINSMLYSKLNMI